MNAYELTLVIDQEPGTEAVEALTAEQFENLGLLATETDNGAVLAHMNVDATSLSTAIIQGIRNLKRINVHVLGVVSEEEGRQVPDDHLHRTE